MSTTIARLQAILDADTRGFDAKMKTSQTKTEKFGHIAKTALIGGVAAGITAVGVAAKIGWDEYNQGAQVAAQTNAAIKSTGGVAGVTAKHVEALGDSMLKLTGIDDEATKAAENQLLTFTKIGSAGGVFDNATQAVADLATRLNNGAIPSMEDMSRTAILVGKALNNPATGLTRLQRIGVEFSASQVKLITHLAEVGKTEQAQAVILRELQTEYGGSAKAAGETFAGSITKLHERFNNFMGDVVESGIPVIQRLAHWLSPKITDAMDQVRKLVTVLRGDWAKLNSILQQHQSTVDKVVTVLGFLATALKLAARWNIFLYGTIIKVELAVLSLALAIGDKLIAAFHKVAGPARAAFAAVAAAVRFALGPIFALISALERVVSLYNSVKGAITSTGSGQPTGRGGSGHRAMGGPVFAGRSYTVGERGPETFVPRVSGTIIPAGGGAVYNFNGPVLDGDALLRYIRGQADKFERRNGRSPF